MDYVGPKERACVDFIRDLWLSHQEEASDAPIPLFIGLNGVQGAGKTMLVGYVLFSEASSLLQIRGPKQMFIPLPHI